MANNDDVILFNSLKSMAADIEALRQNVPGDVILECEGQEIMGHSQVLSARSNVFAKTLQTDMKERREGRIHIERASMGDVKQLVDYMYSGKLDTSHARLKELLVLADRFEVLQLVQLCSSKLSESLDKNNALELGIFGDSYNSKNLVEMCAHYIAANMKESLSQEDWMEIKKSPNLMFEIIKNVKEGESNANDQCIAVMHAIIHILEKKSRIQFVEGFGKCVSSCDIYSRVERSMSQSEMYRVMDILESKGCIIQQVYHDLSRFVKSAS